MRVSPDTKAEIEKIGRHLDRDGEVRIKNGGFVVLSGAPIPIYMGKEKYDDERQEQTRPQSRPRERASGGQGAAGRPRAPRQTPSTTLALLRRRCESEIDTIVSAYPGAQAWAQTNGFLLMTESRLVPGLEQKATMLTVVQYEPFPQIRGWGFWDGEVWIGPRHTNGDGSICAFDPSDDTWCVGEPLVDLLDLYTLWAFCHLHLRTLGRWPGPQSSPHVIERLLELKGEELCGCGRKPYKRYSECCQKPDRSVAVTAMTKFILRSPAATRSPPVAIRRFMRERVAPPIVSSL